MGSVTRKKTRDNTGIGPGPWRRKRQILTTRPHGSDNLFTIPVLQSQFNLRWRGIEPRSPAWQARILPLNHQRKVAQFFRYNVHITQDAKHFHQTSSNNKSEFGHKKYCVHAIFVLSC